MTLQQVFMVQASSDGFDFAAMPGCGAAAVAAVGNAIDLLGSWQPTLQVCVCCALCHKHCDRLLRFGSSCATGRVGAAARDCRLLRAPLPRAACGLCVTCDSSGNVACGVCVTCDSSGNAARWFRLQPIFRGRDAAGGGALHAYVTLLQKWCDWAGPPNHHWNRYMQFLLAALLLGLDLRQQRARVRAAAVRCCWCASGCAKSLLNIDE